jgi:hypothetical protein
MPPDAELEQPPRLAIATSVRCHRGVRWLLYVFVFVTTFGYRFLFLGRGFSNDQFLYITSGWRILSGEWPTRDWFDPGTPLMFLASAGAQYAFGQTLFAEAMLVSAAFALGAVLTAVVVFELVGSVSITMVATLLEVVAAPRGYGYPKVLVYALAFLVYDRYLKRPTDGRMVAMAATIVVAFLFRHDHGLLVGIGAAATIMLEPTADVLSARLRRLALLALVTMALASPYLVYVEVHGGLAAYVRDGIDFSGKQAQWYPWPRIIGDARPLLSALVYALYAFPLAVIAVLAFTKNLTTRNPQAAAILPVVAVALPMNITFIRDPLPVRLSDPIVPAVVLGAWLLHRAINSRTHRGLMIGVTAVASVVFSAAVFDAGDGVRAGVSITELAAEWREVPETIQNLAMELKAGPEHQMPSDAAVALVPFYRYLERCTSVDDRLILAGFLPDVPFFAKRPFAAGQLYLTTFPASPRTDGVALARLRRQRATFALTTSDSAPEFNGGFPQVADYVRRRYVLLTSVRAAENYDVRIMVDGSAQAIGTDAETGWPCFQRPTAVTP